MFVDTAREVLNDALEALSNPDIPEADHAVITGVAAVTVALAAVQEQHTANLIAYYAEVKGVEVRLEKTLKAAIDTRLGL